MRTVSANRTHLAVSDTFTPVHLPLTVKRVGPGINLLTVQEILATARLTTKSIVFSILH